MKRIVSSLISMLMLFSNVYLQPVHAVDMLAMDVISSLTFGAAADARVLEQYPTTNYGITSRIGVDNPGEESYLRFTISGVTGFVQNATLRLYVTNGSTDGPSLYRTDGSWSETAITWNNRPAPTSGAVANVGSVASGGWAEFNLTNVVTGDGSYDFVLLPDGNDGASFYSREGSSPPQLVLTISSASTPTPVDTPTSTDTPIPTDTSTPTGSPTPTDTPTPVDTTTPTDTSTPTGTPTPTGAPITSTLTLPAAADAKVLQASPTTNYGTVTKLDIDNPGQESYIRFTVSGVTGSVQSAKLRLFATNGSSNGPSLYLTSSSWTETGITWNNRPAPAGGAVANIGSVTSNSWAEFNLTAVITGNGSYDFVLLPDSTDGVTFYSREGNSPPQLVISIGTGQMPTPTPTPTNTPVSGDAVFVGAGDIADCSRVQDEQTAQLLDAIPGTVFTIGDNAYPSGSLTNFMNCYDPTWGRHKSRTRPAVGDGEYNTSAASGYFSYFGAAAGDPAKGYYSYDVGSWHIITLNSNCSQVGGCTPTSPQGQWLQADLAAHQNTCTLAIFHEPLFSSNGGDSDLRDFWLPLYAAGADIVLGGHRHNYERFDLQNPNGVLDPGRGIRQFVVGTGGTSLSSFGSSIAPNSQVRNASTYGVLKLTLHASSYDWQFIPIVGQTFTDSGSSACVTP